MDEKVQKALIHDSPDWRLRNACPSCTYILKDEPKLQFNMLYMVDGNDSLKHIIRRETTRIADSNVPVLRDSSESTDRRRVGTKLYLTNEQVNQWSNEVLKDTFPTYVEDDTDQNPCSECWRNMRTELTAKMWGIFEETGLFLALCRHGFVLLLADMIRSGELYVCLLLFLCYLLIFAFRSKYPLVIVVKMLEVFGEDLALRYDIGRHSEKEERRTRTTICRRYSNNCSRKRFRRNTQQAQEYHEQAERSVRLGGKA